MAYGGNSLESSFASVIWRRIILNKVRLISIVKKNKTMAVQRAPFHMSIAESFQFLLQS